MTRMPERLFVAMTSGLLVALLLAIAAPNPAVAADCGNNKSHNVFMGQRAWGDQLVFMDHPKKEGHWLRKVSADSSSGPLSKIITYIEVIDNYTNGNGGCAFLTNGGVGDSNVAFHLKSQRSHGLDFTVNVYGR